MSLLKMKLKKGDFVEVKKGKWKGTKDYIFLIKPKTRTIYLKKVKVDVFRKGVKTERMIPIHSCKIKLI